jgi:hypothetical protein
MRQVELSLTFTDDSGEPRPHRLSLKTPRGGTPEGEARVAHHLFSELRVIMRDQPVPKHNAAAGKWLKFPKTRIDFSQFWDVRNAQSLWLELSNLVRGIEYDLEMARAFKELEPAQDPSFEDDEQLNNLYFLHDRKMNALDRAVYELIKVQNLVDRLLHESLGGDLVDTSDPDWEHTKLTRKNVIKGLTAKHAGGSLSQSEFDAIVPALEIPKRTPHGETARTYRNRLMHHIHPSVDYAIFYSGLESREGETFTDPSGKIVGRKFTMRARPPVEYLFSDLHPALIEYLDAIVAMLQKFSEIQVLRR